MRSPSQKNSKTPDVGSTGVLGVSGLFFFVVLAETGLYDFDQLFHQVVVFDGNEFFHFLAVLAGGGDDLHQVNVLALVVAAAAAGARFFGSFALSARGAAGFVAFFVFNEVGQHSELFAVVEESVDDFQQNAVAVFVGKLYDIAIFFVHDNPPVQRFESVLEGIIAICAPKSKHFAGFPEIAENINENRFFTGKETAVRLLANAKVNWALSVEGRRENGYHELDMVMQSVTLCDTLTIRPADSLFLRARGALVPGDENNLVLKAARVLQGMTGTAQGAEFELRKRIPVGGGLGGGSADAAAALLGLNLMWELGLTETELQLAAQMCGADVPFLLRGGLARVRGIGEQLESLQCAQSFPVVIVQPCRGLSTPQVFGAYDELPAKPPNPDAAAVADALARGDAHALAASMGNALEAAAVPRRPEIAVCAQTLEHFGALRAQMTGSGSAVIALFTDRHVAENASRMCARFWPRTYLAFTASAGVLMEKE